MTLHLRLEDTGLYRGPITCSCGTPDCTRWRDEALETARFSGPRRRDREQMAGRRRAAEALSDG
jgi:hypothetical protein